MFRCPNCGIRLDMAEASLSPRLRAIRDAVETLRRERGRPARTTEIAMVVGFAPTTIKPELAHLEHAGILCRPDGPKSGWAPRKDSLTLMKVA